MNEKGCFHFDTIENNKVKFLRKKLIVKIVKIYEHTKYLTI